MQTCNFVLLESTAISVSILPKTGKFELVHNGKVKFSGTVRSLAGDEQDVLVEYPRTQNQFPGLYNMEMKSKDVYQELRLRCYEYEGEFKGILAAEIKGIFLYLLFVFCWMWRVKIN